MVLLIDNYDSFSYNLFQYIGELTPDIRVIRNDELTVGEIRELAPQRIILSPGPGRPEDAGVIIDVVKELGRDIPILGVCLGHQAICAAFGANVTYAKKMMHGKQSLVSFEGDCPIFRDMPKRSLVARYHSLAAEPGTLPDELRVTALTVADMEGDRENTENAGEIMAVEHREYPIYGVQFHPESIMTPEGKRMIRNFLNVQRG